MLPILLWSSGASLSLVLSSAVLRSVRQAGDQALHYCTKHIESPVSANLELLTLRMELQFAG